MCVAEHLTQTVEAVVFRLDVIIELRKHLLCLLLVRLLLDGHGKSLAAAAKDKVEERHQRLALALQRLYNLQQKLHLGA